MLQEVDIHVSIIDIWSALCRNQAAYDLSAQMWMTTQIIPHITGYMRMCEPDLNVTIRNFLSRDSLLHYCDDSGGGRFKLRHSTNKLKANK